MLIDWDYLYNYIGIKDFIYFISSPSIQEQLFFVKIIFIFFTVFFLGAVIWFYTNSSYIQYKFLQNVTEFLSREAYGLKEVTKNLRKIKSRVDAGSESELKLAVIEIDDFLYQTLQDMGYEGESFEELVNNASKKILSNPKEILEAHAMRNSLVYDSEHKVDLEKVKEAVFLYEKTIKHISAF